MFGVTAACVLGGTLHELFRDFKDRVDFLCVYLAEAHPKGRWGFGFDYQKMDQHKTIQERVEVARSLMEIDAQNHHTFTDDLSSQTKLRLVLDNMDNGFALAYDAHPDRILVIEGGRVTFIGRNVNDQLDQPHMLMTDEAREWLQERLG
ncbi:type I iodothyronine deiodinase-like [Patiria miniata]|uniref:Iodothyronine deiodinase n=1 Tax=Patiria miniata TaxID=46514 RepID=A0A914BNP7_PATMI|nr:type I iodothyronine deiodinase-like [Patiria miniata]